MGASWLTFVTKDGSGSEYPVTRGRFAEPRHALAFAEAWNRSIPSVGVPPITGFVWGFAPIDPRESLLMWEDDPTEDFS